MGHAGWDIVERAKSGSGACDDIFAKGELACGKHGLGGDGWKPPWRGPRVGSGTC